MIAILVICLTASLFSGYSSEHGEIADTVVCGTIYTAVEDNNGLAEAFAVKDGRYILLNKPAVKSQDISGDVS